MEWLLKLIGDRCYICREYRTGKPECIGPFYSFGEAFDYKDNDKREKIKEMVLSVPSFCPPFLRSLDLYTQFNRIPKIKIPKNDT